MLKKAKKFFLIMVNLIVFKMLIRFSLDFGVVDIKNSVKGAKD